MKSWFDTLLWISLKLDWLMWCCTLLQGITANKKYSLLYWAVCKSRPLRFKTLWWISRSEADEGSAPGTRTKSCCVSFVNAPPPTSDLEANTSHRKCFFWSTSKNRGINSFWWVSHNQEETKSSEYFEKVFALNKYCFPELCQSSPIDSDWKY